MLKIMSYLFNFLLSCVKLSVVPIQWHVAAETYIPKVFLLLNVEGKLFFSLISRRMEDHIIRKNKFVNVGIQKGCMEKFPGCWEHMSVVWEELKSSNVNKSNIVAIWLGIANAYGSVPHQIIFFALKRHGVHPLWIKIIHTMKVFGVDHFL